jgi:uncharacterized membrane protein
MTPVTPTPAIGSASIAAGPVVSASVVGFRGHMPKRPGGGLGESAAVTVDQETAPAPDTPPSPGRPARRRGFRWSPWAWAVAVATGLFVVVYGRLVLALHAGYTTQAFDFGIFDQGLWLLSRFEEPFLSVRGLNLFGDHSSLIMIPMAPLFWVWDDPRALLLFTVISLAAGGPTVYAIARRLELRPPIAAALAAGFLLYPAVTWATWWNFHPELLAIPLLLGGFLLTAQHRPRLAAAVVLATLLVKEDAALVVVPMAIWLGLTGMWSRRQALLVGAAGLAVFVLNVTVILPGFTPTGELVYVGRYERWGDTLPDALVGMATNPGLTLSVLFSGRSLAYLARMLLPLPTCLLRPSFLVVGAPVTAANLLSGQLGQQDIKFQYSAYLTAVVAIGAVLGAVRLGRWIEGRTGGWRRVAVVAGGVVGVALAANVAWSPSPIGAERWHWIGPDDADEQRSELLAMIPDDAVVSVDPFLVPHFAHRREVYMFPNPFSSLAWGTGGLPDPPDPARVEWVAVRPDANPAGHPDMALLERLEASGDFDVVVDDGDVVILRRAQRGADRP